MGNYIFFNSLDALYTLNYPRLPQHLSSYCETCLNELPQYWKTPPWLQLKTKLTKSVVTKNSVNNLTSGKHLEVKFLALDEGRRRTTFSENKKEKLKKEKFEFLSMGSPPAVASLVAEDAFEFIRLRDVQKYFLF